VPGVAANLTEAEGNDIPRGADAVCNVRNPTAASDVVELATATRGRKKAEVATLLMEQVVERGHMWTVYERVLRNNGAPGADGMTVGNLEGTAASELAVIESGSACRKLRATGSARS
jgi:hypothetical protein